MNYDETQDEVPSIPEVGEKYKTAADIANRALNAVLSELSVGRNISELCAGGDDVVQDALKAVYPNVRHKGLAFPTCVSPANIVCHFSPGKDDEAPVLSAGDLVRIALGVHIDGYVAEVAHTVMLKVEGDDSPITGPTADTMAACEVAARAALRLMTPGRSSVEVTRAFEMAAANFGVTPVDGVLSHEVKRFVSNGSQCFIQAETAEHATEEFEFKADQVFVVDILMSSGGGRVTEADYKTHVHCRVPDVTYNLKLKSSRMVLSEAMHRFHGMPFALRSLDCKQARMGIVECWRHGLIDTVPILRGSRRESFVHCKFTVVITEDGPVQLTGHDWQQYQSDKALADPDLQQLLQ